MEIQKLTDSGNKTDRLTLIRAKGYGVCASSYKRHMPDKE